jgi:ABC-type multidrug transport system permease subunit
MKCEIVIPFPTQNIIRMPLASLAIVLFSIIIFWIAMTENETMQLKGH